MAHFSAHADTIPGLVTASWVMEGRTMADQRVSLVWLEDGDRKELVEVTGGIGDAAQDSNLTLRMRSYLSGLAEIGDYLSSRKTLDEDDVTEDDIEIAAIIFAFPRVARNEEAGRILKTHLDTLQAKGLLPQIAFTPNRSDETSAVASAAPVADAQSPAGPPADAASEPATPADTASSDTAPTDTAPTDTAPITNPASAPTGQPTDAATAAQGLNATPGSSTTQSPQPGTPPQAG